MAWSPKTLLSSLYKNKKMETVLHDKYNIPRDSVDDISREKADDGGHQYQIQFRQKFINAELVSEFCEYNDLYVCEKNQSSIDVYRIGSKSDLLVGHINRNNPYRTTVKYFDEDKIRSESTATLVMISKFFSYRSQGEFRFVDK